MGTYKVRCPECEHVYHVQESWIPDCGAKIRCEECERLLWIHPPRGIEEEELTEWHETQPLAMEPSIGKEAGAARVGEVRQRSAPSARVSASDLEGELRRWAAGREAEFRQDFLREEFLARHGTEFSLFLEEYAQRGPGPAGPGRQTRPLGWVALEALRRIVAAAPAADPF